MAAVEIVVVVEIVAAKRLLMNMRWCFAENATALRSVFRVDFLGDEREREMNKEVEHPKQRSAYFSPLWSLNTKLFVLGWLLIGVVAALIFFHQLALYFLLAIVVTYMVRPIVDRLENESRLSRTNATLFVYLFLLIVIIAIPISILPSIVAQILSFINNVPALIQDATLLMTNWVARPLELFGQTFQISELWVSQYETVAANLISLLSTWVSSLSGVATGVATGTAQVFSWLAFIFFISFYLTRDGRVLSDFLHHYVPLAYRDDMRQLSAEINTVWGSFLRGQLTLMLGIGVITFILASFLGLNNALPLAIIAGCLEIIPYIGPLIAALPALLIAYFQAEMSWLGGFLTPFWFMVVVAITYWLIQQLENYILLPRIMGNRLQLHPVIVFIGAIAGYQIGGLWGIFLASPLIATIKIILRYCYYKLIQLPTDLEITINVSAENKLELTPQEDAVEANSSPAQPPPAIS